MCDNTSDFSDVNVGDKLWSMQLGECEVCRIDYARGEMLIWCQNNNGRVVTYYDKMGRRSTTDLMPSLFWSRPEIIAPPKPKRKVVKTVEAWANVYCAEYHNVLHTTLEDANEAANDDRIACVRLTGTYEVFE